MDGTGLAQLHSMDWTGLNWTGVHVSGVDWTEPDSTSGLNWTALHFTGLSKPEFDFTRLHYTALPWIELKITMQNSQFTAPR